MDCLYPHCCCAGKCSRTGCAVPTRDPSAPLFKPAQLRELADRHDLAIKIKTDPGFHLSNEDMKAIAFALRFTAERL